VICLSESVFTLVKKLKPSNETRRHERFKSGFFLSGVVNSWITCPNCFFWFVELSIMLLLLLLVVDCSSCLVLIWKFSIDWALSVSMYCLLKLIFRILSFLHLHTFLTGQITWFDFFLYKKGSWQWIVVWWWWRMFQGSLSFTRIKIPRI